MRGISSFVIDDEAGFRYQ